MLCAIYSLKSRATYLCQLHQLISQMTKNRQNKIYLVTNHGNQGLQLYHNLPQTTWGQNTKHSGQWCYLEKPKVITSFLQSKKTVKLRETLKMQGYASTKNTIKNLHQGTSTSRNILTISLSLSLSLSSPSPPTTTVTLEISHISLLSSRNLYLSD